MIVVWQVTRKLGLEDISLRLEEACEDAEKFIVSDRLQAAGQDMVKHYIDQYASKIPGNKPLVDVTHVTVPALTLVPSIDKGKRLLKVTAGEWTKFGVPFYDEHAKESGIDPKEVPDEGWKLTGKYEAVVEVHNGNPKRVLKLVKYVSASG